VLSIDFSSDSSVDFECRAGHNYLVTFANIAYSDDQNSLCARVSTDGSTFDAGASDYSWQVVSVSGSATTAGYNDSSDSEMTFGQNAWTGNAAASEAANGFVWFYDPADSGGYTRASGQVSHSHYSGSIAAHIVNSVRQAAQADVAVRLFPLTGNFATGRLAVWEFPL
jgi:hypothetical protein